MFIAPAEKLAHRAVSYIHVIIITVLFASSSLSIRRDLRRLPVCHRITYKMCLTTWKTLHTSQPLYTCLNSFLTIFHPDPCVLPIQIFLLDHPVLLATFPLGPFLCLHLLLRTLYLRTFVLSIYYPPLNAT